MDNRDKRIFWLGMHVVLTQTELPRLRQLGYEVFNPPYLSEVYDQSAVTAWDPAVQQSTLPPEVFAKLAKTNFFYNPIPPDIGEILNDYFGTVLLTINPDWLYEMLKVYRGRLIYRTYGQPFTISEALVHRGCVREIQSRDNFFILPHAQEAVIDEHAWFRQRMHVVPYALPADVFEHRDMWAKSDHRREIMVNIPNIRNAYYASQYNHINTHFPQEWLKIYGVQPEPINDPRVVGTLPRKELLLQYHRLSGCFYPYHDNRVCYLPPIEFMTVGGPVVFVENSLLHRYFEGKAPGLAVGMDEQRKKIAWLLKGDQEFISDVIASQEPVRRRYSPEYVWPIFDETIRKIVGNELGTPQPSLIFPRANDGLAKAPHEPQRKRIYVLFHFPGGIVAFQNGKYFSFEGIPRVMQKFVKALLEQTGDEIILTSFAHQAFHAHGFFNVLGADGRLKVLVVNPAELPDMDIGILKRFARLIRRNLRKLDASISSLPKEFAAKSARQRSLRQLTLMVRLPLKALAFCLKVLTRLIFILWCMLHTLRKGFSWCYTRFRRSAGRLYRRFKMTGLARWIWNSPPARHYRDARNARWTRDYVSHINRDPRARFALVPHYYLFSEAAKLQLPLMMYLPDYTPHFFKGVSFDRGRDEKNAVIGRTLAAKCAAIFTNSYFTKSYLSQTALRVDTGKVGVIPIPLLVGESKQLAAEESLRLNQQFGGKKFIFYPTANRPNKQIAFLLEIFAELLQDRPELRLVLTCSLQDYAPALETYNRFEEQSDRNSPDWTVNAEGSVVQQKAPRLSERVIFMQGAPDSMVEWLYTNAAMLCFTSTMEGNFPPQVFEAMTYGTPIVATRLPLITELLQEDSEALLLCPPLDKEEFLTKARFAMEHPEEVRQRQKIAYQRLLAHNNDEKFSSEVGQFLHTYRLI